MAGGVPSPGTPPPYCHLAVYPAPYRPDGGPKEALPQGGLHGLGHTSTSSYGLGLGMTNLRTRLRLALRLDPDSQPRVTPVLAHGARYDRRGRKSESVYYQFPIN